MATCSKIPYRSLQAAKVALHAVRRSARVTGRRPPTGAYLCSICRAWHLTSKSRIQRPPWAKGRCHAAV